MQLQNVQEVWLWLSQRVGIKRYDKMPIPVYFMIICQILEYGLVGYLKTTIPFKEQPRSIKITFRTAKTMLYIIFHSYFTDHNDLQNIMSGEL